MVSLSYTQSESRHRRSSPSHDVSGGVSLNWRLLLALTINVAAWVAIVKLVGQLI